MTVRLVGAGVAAVALTVAVGVQARRAVRVLRSFETHAAYWNDRAQEAGEILYVALGDSTAQGVGAADPARGYVGRLADDIATDTGRTVRVVNLSVTGAKVADVVREQLPALAKLLADHPAPAVVTVTIGANDTGRTPRERFRSDMQQIVDALPAGARVAEVPYFRGRRGADAAAFSAVIRELVQARRDLVLVPLLEATTGLRPREYAHDLFHPSELGYDRYYQAFAAAGVRSDSREPSGLTSTPTQRVDDDREQQHDTRDDEPVG